MFYLYILKSTSSGRYYIGSSDNVEHRLVEHNSGKTPSTRNRGPWVLMHTEAFSTLSEARKREYQVKSWKNRAYMETMLGL
jgi:putative endonuclease